MLRRLTEKELDALLGHVSKDEHFLYYTYLTSRRSRSIHYGHFSPEGEMLGVLAYLRGMPFHAFSVLPLSDRFAIEPLVRRIQSDAMLPSGAEGSFILSEEVRRRLEPQLHSVIHYRPLMTMMHPDPGSLPPADGQVVPLKPEHKERIVGRMREFQSIAFTEEELQYPCVGIFEDNELVAVGGYHVYSAEAAELGNIGTIASRRGRGYGANITAELVRTASRLTSYVLLEVFNDNEPAIRLYRTLGFEQVNQLYMTSFRLPVLAGRA
ncbi:GNAT family N-acetyltransferase [Paenibacillus dendritiformis]|uniref:GNAT family N-acetyltransferase n=1 Tax=Paenibacillus dendritiformis TaxID=130049 RepID=UPI00248C42D5|nr:GNAT family N-acetyltransferase [Paenibacillus dendritiformis]WGU96605.1 GNAT family N-acetyltransferase [Paenibacillus dendritiformis]